VGGQNVVWNCDIAPMTADLFKEKYGHEIEGVWFPRVTSICALVSGSSFLKKADPFGRRFGFQQAALWGQMVHEAVEKILKGEEAQFDVRIAPSIETFRLWREQYPFSIVDPDADIERRVVDLEQGYAGTVDIVAEVDGVVSIIDLKTSTGFAKEYGLQTAAYMNAYNKMEFKKQICEKRWILRLDQYQECLGCQARMREKSGRERITGESANGRMCNHQWSSTKGEIEFQELQGYEQDLEQFFDLKERWEWTNQEWLDKISNYEKNIRQYTLL